MAIVQEKLEGVGSEYQQGLALAAADHIWDIGQTGTASHSSSDGTSAAPRTFFLNWSTIKKQRGISRDITYYEREHPNNQV